MGKAEKAAVPGWLRDAVADNLQRFMDRPPGWNAAQLAKAAGLNYPKTVERLLRQETKPTLSTLCALAVPLDVKVWEFLIPVPAEVKSEQPMMDGRERRLPENTAAKSENSEAKKKDRGTKNLKESRQK